MRATYPDLVEKGRHRLGPFRSAPGDRAGLFALRHPGGCYLVAMASDGCGWLAAGFAPPAWEHVSVTAHPRGVGGGHRCPTWEEMAWVKSLFWGDEEAVVQFHPPRSEYVNRHESCLHLWRPVGVDIPRPPAAAVG